MQHSDEQDRGDPNNRRFVNKPLGECAGGSPQLAPQVLMSSTGLAELPNELLVLISKAQQVEHGLFTNK